MSQFSVMPARPDWNRMGPPIPCWFRVALRKFDPSLALQFVPPWSALTSGDRHKGMNDQEFPYGGWHICRRLKRTGWLHKLAVYSLMDRQGRYAPPTRDLMKILRWAKHLWCSREYHKMEDMLDRSLDEINREKVRCSKEQLQEKVHKYLSLAGNRQFSNRVFYSRSA